LLLRVLFRHPQVLAALAIQASLVNLRAAFSQAAFSQAALPTQLALKCVDGTTTHSDRYALKAMKVGGGKIMPVVLGGIRVLNNMAMVV